MLRQYPQLNVPLLEITTPGENDTSLYTVATGEAIWFQLYEAIQDQARSDFYWAIFEEPGNLAYTREVVRTTSSCGVARATGPSRWAT